MTSSYGDELDVFKRPLPSIESYTPVEDISVTDYQSRIEDSIEQHGFVAIIGAECSALNRRETEAWKELARQVNAVDSLVDGPEHRYLQSIALEPGHDAPLNESGPPKIAPIPQLTALRKTLVELGARATTLFHDRVSRSAKAVSDSNHFFTEITNEDGQVDELAILLGYACKAAYDLNDVDLTHLPSFALPIFDRTHVYQRLGDLMKELLQNKMRERVRVRWQSKGLLDDNQWWRSYLAEQDNSTEGTIVLQLYHLEWLADLLWYTFRVSCPAYPTAEELAFQVALHASQRGDSRRRPDTVDAFQVLGEQTGESIEAWFTFYGRIGQQNIHDDPKHPELDGRSSAMTTFYGVVADSLAATVEHRLMMREARDPREAGDRVGPQYEMPFVYSTNLDLEMERALEGTALATYHVAIPVLEIIGRRRNSQLRFQRWILLTLERGTAGWSQANSVWINNDATWTSHLRGPLVVKLHGSPLHDIPAVIEGVKVTGEEHALTLSQVDYLHQTLEPYYLPQQLYQYLREENKDLYFLGQSLDEWNIRMRMFDLVYSKRDPGRQERVTQAAINQRFDKYRSEVLAAVGLRRWQGDLSLISDAVEEAVRHCRQRGWKV